MKLQDAMNDLAAEAHKVGLSISDKKSKILHVNAKAQMREIVVGSQHFEEVVKFTYLGSVSVSVEQ